MNNLRYISEDLIHVKISYQLGSKFICPVTSKMQKIFFPSTDGLRLCGIWQKPKQKTKKAIILAHGITVDKDESCEIFVNLANALVKKNFAVFRFDFRGHGESEGKSVDMTIYGEIEDLRSAYSLVAKEHDEIGLLGTSFGGGISALFAAQSPEKLKCLCLWNPTLNYDHTYLNPTIPSIKKFKEHIPKDFAEKGWSEIYSRKFKIGKQLFDGMRELFPYEELKKIKIPAVIIHGDKDSYVPFEDSKEYVNNLLGIKEFINISGSEHGFVVEPFATEAIQKTCEFFKKYL